MISPSVAAGYVPIDLTPWRDNVGVTGAGDRGAGRFNVWRNSLPADQVPGGQALRVDGVPFAFPEAGAGRPDNVRCSGQVVRLPRGRYDWLYLLAAAERRVEDEVAVHFADGSVDFEPLRLTDFWAAPAAYGETAAVRTTHMNYPHHRQPGVSGTIWCQRVPVVRRADAIAVRLPDNPAAHLFALTVAGTGGAR